MERYWFLIILFSCTGSWTGELGGRTLLGASRVTGGTKDERSMNGMKGNGFNAFRLNGTFSSVINRT